MRVAMYQGTRETAGHRAGAWARYHGVSVAILLVFIALGQMATLMQRPLAYAGADTHSYYVVALQILRSPSGLIQTLRTPGYPFFWALIMRIAGVRNEDAVVYAQAAIAVLMLLECYVLLYRITYRRWIACTVASLLAVNLYWLSTERVLETELLSYWSIVTLMLVYERLVRRPRLRTALLFGLWSFVAIMIRPISLYLPALLLALLFGRTLWMHRRSARWTQIWKSALPMLAAGSLLGVLLVSYAALNAQVNGFLGISWLQNITLFGKVMQYHLDDTPVPPQYATLQASIEEYIHSNPPYPADVWSPVPPDPWTYVNTHQSDYYGQGMSYQSGFRPVGGYAQYIVLHHLGAYIRDSLPYVYVVWTSTPQLYPPYSTGPNGHWVPDSSAIPGLTGYPIFAQGVASAQYEPGWVNMLLGISTIIEESYALLPMVLVLLGYLLVARPRKTFAFVLLALALCASGSIVVAAFGNYAEFYRLRSPLDWAMIAVTTTLVLDYLARFLALAKPAGEAGTRTPADAPSISASLPSEAIPTWRGVLQTMAESTLMAAVPDEAIPPWRRWAVAWMRRQRPIPRIRDQL